MCLHIPVSIFCRCWLPRYHPSAYIETIQKALQFCNCATHVQWVKAVRSTASWSCWIHHAVASYCLSVRQREKRWQKVLVSIHNRKMEMRKVTQGEALPTRATWAPYPCLGFLTADFQAVLWSLIKKDICNWCVVLFQMRLCFWHFWIIQAKVIENIKYRSKMKQRTPLRMW